MARGCRNHAEYRFGGCSLFSRKEESSRCDTCGCVGDSVKRGYGRADADGGWCMAVGGWRTADGAFFKKKEMVC